MKLQPRSNEFFEEMCIQLFVGSQMTHPILGSSGKAIFSTRNPATIQDVFAKAIRVESLSINLSYYLKFVFKGHEKVDEDTGEVLQWARTVAQETVMPDA
jgi:nucleolar MIF4G domain-containing protein 1